MTTGPELAESGALGRLARAYRPLMERLASLGPGLAAAGWGLLLGHTALLGDVAPFGLAYAAAVRRADPPRAAWAAVGALDNLPGLAARVGVAVVGAAAGLATVAAVPAPELVPLPAVLSAVLGAVLYLPFVDGVRVAEGRPSARLTLEGAESVGFLLLLSCALATVSPYAPFGLPAATVLLPLAAQGTARVAGAGAGAVAGMAIGALFVLSGGAQPPLVLMAAAGAVLGAWGRRYGNAWGALGAAAGGLVFARTLGPTVQDLVAGIGGYLLATAIAWASPAALWEVAASYVGLAPARPDRALRRRLREISRVMDMLSTAVVEQAAATPSGDAARAYAGQAERLVQGVTRRACVGCGQYGQCWHHDVQTTYMRLQAALTHLEQPGSEPEVEEGLRSWCLRPRPVAIALGYVNDLHEVESRLVRRWRATRSALSEPLRGVSEVLGSVGEAPPEASADHLAYAWGLAMRPRGGNGGGRMNGDACMVRPLPGARLLVALSDGMGVGTAAAVESEPTVRLAERLLETGFGVRTAAQTVNSLMVLEGSEDTFATLDLAVLQLTSGEAEFVKIGAQPTLLVRRGRLERLEVHTPPAGILREVRVDVRRRRLASGDWLVTMTDGAFDPLSRDPDWLEGFLRALSRARGPQWVADQLLRKACEVGGEGMDDATVAVVRLGPGHGAEL
jgi:stage II sporulation protein E